MMYVESEQEIREWILFGRPRRLESETDQRAIGELPVRMPAYEGVISSGQLDDLVEYYKAVAFFEKPPPQVREGYRIASQLGCFGCHGPGGQLGAANPQSFKGYIPPWQGEDYSDLVRDRDELRAWILDGEIERFASNPAARRFMDRQVIQMPAYRNVLTDDELEALMGYIEWLNRGTS